MAYAGSNKNPSYLANQIWKRFWLPTLHVDLKNIVVKNWMFV